MARHSNSGRKMSLHKLSPTVTTTKGHQRCVDRFKIARAAEARHIKGTVAGNKMKLATHFENEETWQRYVEVGTRGRRETGVQRALAKVQVKIQAKAKARHEHLKHECVVERNDARKQIGTCSNCGKVGHLRAVCRNTNTCEIEKGADEPSPEVTVEEVRCMLFQKDAVDDGLCDCTEKHDVLSEHRDDSKFKDFPEHRDESKDRQVITNIETVKILDTRTSRWVKILEKS